MKKITMTLVLTALVCLLVPFASAQLNDRTTWKASVPYSFMVENTKMPAGEYRLQWVSGRIRIESVNGSYRASVITLPVQGKKTQENSILQFSNYGGEHFLTSIWFAGAGEGRELLKSKTEVQLAKRQAPAQVAVLMVH